jgi:hypothetical protein
MKAEAVMFTWRRFVSIFAILGVLLHASAIVRHNAFALDAALDSSAKAVALGEICSGLADSDHTSSGKPKLLRCPICAGLPGSLLVPAAADFHVPSAFAVQRPVFFAANSDLREILLFVPPGRGPPLDA